MPILHLPQCDSAVNYGIDGERARVKIPVDIVPRIKVQIGEIHLRPFHRPGGLVSNRNFQIAHFTN